MHRIARGRSNHRGSRERRCSTRRDEGETLRSLARLRNALSTRSGLERETIEELTRAIKAIWSSAIEWGNRRKLERVASLTYSLSDDRLCLTINDEAGWLEGAERARRRVAGRPGERRGYSTRLSTIRAHAVCSWSNDFDRD